MTIEKTETRLEYLDGLRGLAALWVFVGHATHFSQLHIPIVSNAEFAVDLFMMLSGFLMYYHAILRYDREPMNRFGSWASFWARRYFRIAPLYYVLLAAALIVGPYIAEYWEALRMASGKEYATDRFYDSSWANILAHVTFVFGFLPDWDYNTPLPDWSISLEMQFYAVFPAIVLAMVLFGRSIVTVVAMGLCALVWLLAPDYLESFWSPSMLVLKLNIFFAGMFVAACLFTKDKRKILKYIFCAAIVAILPFHYSFGLESSLLRLVILSAIAVLALQSQIPNHLMRDLAEKISSLLGNRFFHFLGEMSYSVYLLHFLTMIPFAGYLLINHGETLSAPMRFFIILLVVTPVTYALSWVLHHLVEQPGITLGKRVMKPFNKGLIPKILPKT